MWLLLLLPLVGLREGLGARSSRHLRCVGIEVLWVRVLSGGGKLRGEERRGVVGSAVGDWTGERIRGLMIRVGRLKGGRETREIRRTGSIGVVLICHCWRANVSILHRKRTFDAIGRNKERGHWGTMVSTQELL